MKLDADVLGRLLLDRALGELPPDVEAVLDALLAEDPEARRLAAELSGTVAQARDALTRRAEAQPVDLPPLRFGRPAGRPHRGPARFATAAAACLLFGLCLGWWTSGLRPGRRAGGPARPAVVLSADVPAGRESKLWNTEKLWQRAVNSRKDRRPRVAWSSPWTLPKMERLP
jgi:anti-sigma factor RsiW